MPRYVASSVKKSHAIVQDGVKVWLVFAIFPYYAKKGRKKERSRNIQLTEPNVNKRAVLFHVAMFYNLHFKLNFISFDNDRLINV